MNENPARCPECGTENRSGASFCSTCGARIMRACTHCKADVPPGARFCDRCGQPVLSPGTNASDQGETRPPREVAQPATFAGGRYKVLRLLGEGGKKRVYLAHDTRLERDVALAVIKTEGLDEAGVARVRREARAMGKLGDHPHVVTVHDVGEENSQPYIVSQHMAGGDVAGLLDRAEQHRLPVPQALRIAEQICAALEHAHGRGVIHRDLKPGNVWLTEDGTAKLGDFGLAVALDRSRLTQAGTMVGTVAYMAPEQALGRPPDPRSDLYALGALLYEMVTGRPPFLGDDPVAIISQHINTPPVAPSWHNPEMPRELETLLIRLLAKTPEERPAQAATVREMLHALSASSVTTAAAAHEQANPLDRLASGVFVGRDSEERELRTALHDALSGRGRLIMLAGEPGIGKTRIAEELATYARLRNAQTLWGRCYEGDGAPAFWPWMQIVRAYVHERDSASLMSALGSGAADIAQMVSEVRERLPGLPMPPVLEPEQARFRLFTSVASFLHNAANGQALVLILDDLHWADKPSLLLLHFLARDLAQTRLLIVGTYRDVELRRHHPLSQTLAELAREQLCSRVHLSGLGERDVARFIEMTAGMHPPDSLVSAVYRETEGNPFFVTEVVRLLVADDRLERPHDVKAWSVIIPQGVRDVIGRRLDHLSEASNRALAVAAVIGRDFDLEVLERLSDLPEEQLVSALEEAVAARVVTETAPERYGFAHALIRETLYEELTLTRRARLHRQIGTVLEEFHGGRRDSHLPELAYHFFQAARAGGADKAVSYAARAAERALTLLAYEEGARFYQMALQALDLNEAPSIEGRADLLLALADAQWKAGEIAASKQTLLQAAELARSAHLPQALARAALGFGAGLGGAMGVAFGVRDEAVVALLEQALLELGSEDSALRARVLASLAIALYWSNEAQRRDALSRDAVEMARRLGDSAALAQALHGRHFALWGPQNVAERLAVATEIIGLAQVAGEQETELRGRLYRIGDLLELGHIDAATIERETFIQRAELLRQPYYLWWAAIQRFTQPMLQGRFEEADQLAQAALAIGQRAEDPNALQIFGSQMFPLRWAQGRLAEIEAFVNGFAEQYAGIPGWRCALALMYAELGRDADARAELDRLAVNDFGEIPRDITWAVAMTLLAQVCALLGDMPRAAILYAQLLPCAGHVVMHPASVCIGSVDLPLAVLAATQQQWESAERHFEVAMRMNTALGARPFVALTQYAWAAMRILRGDVNDSGQVALLNEALVSAHALGMKSLVERALTLKLLTQGVDSGSMANSIDCVVSAVQDERPDLRPHTAPDGTVTILFSDIEGYTALTERLGDHRAQALLRSHHRLVRERVAAHGGFEVKSQGDGFMLAFPSARRAVLCAAAIERAVAVYAADHPDEAFRIRIGLHTGEVIREADDFYGKNVILAARIAAQAHGGEILISGVVKELIESGGDIAFGTARVAELKGLSGTYTLYPIEWQTNP
ncbi:MAG TPA: protein kinase [Candidatus Binatia bacterium]|nr:protein kinase [Candidatus Binatia bacterium]